MYVGGKEGSVGAKEREILGGKMLWGHERASSSSGKTGLWAAGVFCGVSWLRMRRAWPR